MAVQKMKLINITGPADDFERIAGRCIIDHDFHPENAMEIMGHSKVLRSMGDINPYADYLGRAVAIAEQLGIALDHRDFSEDGISVSDAVSRCENLCERVMDLRNESSRLLGIANENEQIIRQLVHIHGVNFDLHDFFEVEFVRFRFGRIPRPVYDSFSDEIDNSDVFYFFETSVEKDYVYGMILTARVNEDRSDALFASYGFERIYIAGKVRGSSDEAMKSLKDEADAARAEAEILIREAEKLVADEADAFLSWYSYIRFRYETAELKKYAVYSDTTFYFFGWVPEGCVGDLERSISKLPDVTFSADDPKRIRGISPPVALRNSRLFRPFEPFVEMYGKPSYGEIDPTPVMAVLYTIFFGIMFGDVGQGVIVAAVGYLLWRFKKMWLGRVLIYAGLAGCAFGFLYGSFFGFEHLLPFGFKVLESASNTDMMLRAAVYTGIGVILAVMGLNIVNGLRQRDYGKALFSQNGLAGILLYISVMLLVLPMLGFLDVRIDSTLLIVVGILLPLLMVVFRGPLGKLVSGDRDWFPEDFGGYLIENAFELIEVLLSYVANTISFLRVGIFALSHAGMMMVVFLLAGDPPNPVVVAIGNVIVMGMEGLLVGIQVLRLNFYEMFGRFYAADGREYRPVKIDYKTITE